MDFFAALNEEEAIPEEELKNNTTENLIISMNQYLKEGDENNYNLFRQEAAKKIKMRGYGDIETENILNELKGEQSIVGFFSKLSKYHLTGQQESKDMS